MTSAPQHYSTLLDTLKTYFPSPVSNPILDGYFVHTVSGFLDRVDALKSAAPVLGDWARRSRFGFSPVQHDLPKAGEYPAWVRPTPRGRPLAR